MTSGRPGPRRPSRHAAAAPLAGVLAAVLASLGLLVLAAPAWACSCADANTAQHVRRADAVFTGTLLRVGAAGRGSPTGPDAEVSLAFQADRVYKGVIGGERVRVISPASAASCGLADLTVGKTYTVFATTSGDHLTASSCGGTDVRTQALVDRVETAVGGQGRPVTEPAPPAAERTVLQTGEVPPFTRLAAPGAAMALVGLLGLLVVGRVGRSR